MDLKNIMNMANQLRSQLGDVQKNAAQARFVGEAGGGLVRVVISGRHEVVEVKIDKAAVSGDDLSLLEDLVRAAVNQAVAKVTEGLQQQIGSMAQGMGLDLASAAQVLNPDKDDDDDNDNDKR